MQLPPAPGRPVRTVAHDGDRDSWVMASAEASRALAPAVTGYTDYWERTGSFTTRRELPSLQSVLIVNLGRAVTIIGGDGLPVTLAPGDGFVAGIHDRHAFSQSAGGQAGVHVWLTPRGVQQLFGGAAPVIANRAVTLAEILGARARDLGSQLLEAPDRESRFRVLDTTLAAWRHEGSAPRPDMEWAFAQLRRDPGTKVASLADAIGCSRKTLTARFQAQYGIAPKTAARLARFERLVAICNTGGLPDWAALAQDCGYFDQSHLIRDFTAFAGLTPTEYARRLQPGGGVIEDRR
jgi:AraC-like DNA-binding protein